MMTGVGGLQSTNPSSGLSRTLDRVLEESVLTGEILLSGRKIKEYPKCACKYNLSDTVIAGKNVTSGVVSYSKWPSQLCFTDFVFSM